MTDEEMRELVKLRLESSRELYNDACNLYEQGSYKSAYYNCLTGILFMKIIRNLIKQIINYMHP